MIYFDEVITPDNLVDQYHIALHGKADQTRQIKYEELRFLNLDHLYQRLLNDSYVAGPDNRFTIYEPKKRLIVANDFEDKIVQGLLVRKVLVPLMEPKLISDNYASRQGMGTDNAIERLQSHLHNYYITNGNSNIGCFLKGDIRKYFYSVFVPICHAMIDALDMDDRLKNLFHQEIRPYDTIDTGICIGHEISQWLSIYYLNKMDHTVKEDLMIRYYSRYMDDFILLHSSKEYLEYAKIKISDVLAELHLQLNPEKSQIHYIGEGMTFLGFHFYLTESGKVKTILLERSIKDMRRRMFKYESLVREDINQMKFVLDGFTSWKSHAVKGDAKKILYLMDMEFFNLYYPYMAKLGINFSDYCYLPGKFEHDSTGHKKSSNYRYLIWAAEIYSKWPIDIDRVRTFPR